MLYNRKTEAAALWQQVKQRAAHASRRWLQRSPAMAAGITDHLCSIRDVLMTISVPANSI